MVQILTGGPGSGKTKALVQLVHAAVEQSAGNVICVEKKRKLVHEVTNRARLIATDDYAIAGFDAFYGFLAGVCASNHDITDIFVDATLRIGSRDAAELLVFLQKVSKLAEASDTAFTFTVSAGEAALPTQIFDVVKKVS
ncbi:MAG: mS29 family ribosomal protein [Oscillospiraceae bacterium]|nr:mS29 family ribosomal protein [Oscillospiraceae bacterium]